MHPLAGEWAGVLVAIGSGWPNAVSVDVSETVSVEVAVAVIPAVAVAVLLGEALAVGVGLWLAGTTVGRCGGRPEAVGVPVEVGVAVRLWTGSAAGIH